MKLFALALAALLSTAAVAKEGDASFAVSPESAFSLLDTAIRDARESIVLNIYMLTNKNITQLLADRAQQNNIKVTVLLEGETFGGEMLLPVKRVLDDLYLRFDQQTEGRGKFLVMTSNGSAKRRFVFTHAKYMVVDGKKVFVSSENITGSAFNNKNLSGGTRGWEMYVENAALGAELTGIFNQDSDTSFGDVVPYQKANFKVKDPGNSPLPPRTPRDVPLFSMTSGKVSSASLCASPKSLQCILDFIKSAKSSLSIEHLSLPRYWVSRDGGANKDNPIVQEILAAAKRGVNVRVLLNDDNAFGDDNGVTKPEEKNQVTVDYLNAAAKASRLSLQAGTFNFKALEVNYVHNKGMVADGERVFVSSINGTENSVMNNREVAVSAVSKDAASFFGGAFDADWRLSVK